MKESIERASIETVSAEITMIPSTTVACDAATASKVLRLIEAIEEHDDVQKEYTNADIPDEVLESLS